MPSSPSQCHPGGYRKEGAGDGQVPALLQGGHAQTQLLHQGPRSQDELNPSRIPFPFHCPFKPEQSRLRAVNRGSSLMNYGSLRCSLALINATAPLSVPGKVQPPPGITARGRWGH